MTMGDLPKSTIFTEEIDQEPWEKTRGCPLIFRQGCGLWVSSGANGSTVDLDVFSVSIYKHLTSDWFSVVWLSIFLYAGFGWISYL